MSEYHNPVLLSESIDALITDPDGVYADLTFGGGGHSAAILERLSPKGRLVAFDRDCDALRNRIDDPRLTLVRSNFRFVHNHLTALGFCSAEKGIDGILADLGVSSHQFDEPQRGFSFRFEQAPLDMRMNPDGGRTAADVIAAATEKELENILRLYGEVDGARRAAQLILYARAKSPIVTVGGLNAALKAVTPASAPHKYLAKIYQALRIEVNEEMRSLEKMLSGATASLREGGRLVVITYHSLEDRMVKNFIRTGNVAGELSTDIYGNAATPLKAVERKPVLPSEEEIASNTRARSAKLRSALKTAAL